MLPLTGVHVLDLTRHLPGPYATLMLAELGAEVVKLEPPGGDPVRGAPPFGQGGVSAFHAFLNRGKRSVVLDLREEDDRAAGRRLALAADVVVESFRPGVMARLGLDPAGLLAEKPPLIVCSITGFGQEGSLRDRAGHDLGYLALAGLLGDEAQPAMSTAQIADLGGGAQPAVIGILAALLERDRTGEGRHLDVAITAAVGRWLGPHGPGPDDRRLFTGGFACYRPYATADGRWLALSAIEPRFFARLCEAIGRPELAEAHHDPGRQAWLAAELEAVFGRRPLAAWVAQLHGVDCCVEPVLTPEEAAAGPALREREGLRTIDGAPAPALSPAPALGADTEAVLAALR
jgi:crotonobetainyl-CoA:carnitine CoA-transferase CaiB-like acyl-CoA transferase